MEGTSVYSTKAPKGIDISFEDKDKLKKDIKSKLKRKLKYDKTLGIVQITGILLKDDASAYDEVRAYKEISNDEEWGNSLKRIENQQEKLFKEILSGIFENEQSKTEWDIIKAGDIIIPLSEKTTGEDKNTVPKKQAAFLKIFMPYLRKQLSYRLIIDLLSNFTGLDAKTTDVLVSGVLKNASNDLPIYSLFEKTRESEKTVETDWCGYLIPNSNASYTFLCNAGSKPTVSIDGVPLEFSSATNDDVGNDEWWSDAKSMETGKLYKLTMSGIDIKNLYWKTATSVFAPIPSSALLPEFTYMQCKTGLITLKKAALLVHNFGLNADEIQFFDLHKADFDNLDFNKLTLTHLLRLEGYTRLRNSLSPTKLNLLEFLKWVMDKQTEQVKTYKKFATELIENIAYLLNSKADNIEKLIAVDKFNISKLEDYRNEKNLLKLQEALSIVDKIGVDIDSLFDWAVPVKEFDILNKQAQSIKDTLRAKFNYSDWEQVVKPLNDQLRTNQKEALIAYLLNQKDLIKANVKDVDGLFEYFLIDVQMEATMETSRIKQAISSVQLFIQRCFLGLEQGINSNALDRQRWEWMQQYRVWEANRKVFLYPENWIESNLRDDKSPFFKELESELLQKDINKQNVVDALKSYIYKVDEVANMEVVGLYIEGTNHIENNKTVWAQGAKLHVFSRTRNAPYVFYYRYLDLYEMNWYPWEKIQVDIPSYDVERKNSENGELKLQNGCYLIPVVWNGRLIIFFPQIMKKTQSKDVAADKNWGGLANEPINNSKPMEFYEIKMAWSEYRNGKWTQKQISKDSLYSDIISIYDDIQYFKFVPIVYDRKVIINFDDNFDVDYQNNSKVIKYDNGYKGAFKFDGSSLSITERVACTEEMPILYFNYFIPDVEGKLISGIDLPKKIDDLSSNREERTNQRINLSRYRRYSWQIDCYRNNRQNKIIYFCESNSKVKVAGLRTKSVIASSNAGKKIKGGTYCKQIDFNHPYMHMLLSRSNNLELFFRLNLGMDAEQFGPFDHDDNSSTPNIYHELKRPYSLYNWELFFHTPILLADALSKAQQFEEAMKWFHYVFNPLANGENDTRFWQFSPFINTNSQKILDSIFNNLKSNGTNEAINEWRNKPFMPHVVARSRPVAYMKWVVMKYLDNIISWADYLFRQDTIETINQATQLYVLAGHILGPRPMVVPKQGKIKKQTYLSLFEKWDDFSNCMVDMELALPFSNQTTISTEENKEIGMVNIFGFASSLYFCIPNNPKLIGYWDTIADRLFKIRHCQNIDGIFRQLPLFEPPIDPGLLVKAAAHGLSISSVLNDLNTSMPNYRFYYLLQKAMELCNELKSLGGEMLSAIEKKDNEAMTLIRAKHEGNMQNLVMEIKKRQLEEAEKNIECLMQNRKASEARMKYYLKLSGLDESLVPSDTADFNGIPNDIATVDGESGLKLIPFEKEEMDKAHAAHVCQIGASSAEALAAILHALPDASIAAMPLGIGGEVKYGGSNLGNAANAASKGIQIMSSILSYESNNAGKKAGFKRALQERIFQANAAGYELKNIDKQIIAQKIRIDIANWEIANQQKAIDNASEVEEFIKNKYTNEELYTWMRGSLKGLYHQVYDLAYELAKKAEKTYCFERGISSANFIQSGCFDVGRDGLLAGEQLYVGLKRLEAAYQNERGHDYEITKQISLYKINPMAILQLRETNKCEFEFPEMLFDMDYPGHYRRRIKSVSISIPCIVGPYTGINATLSLLENKFRNTAIVGKAYQESTEEADTRFSSYNIPIDAIAASSAQNDSGMFELNFRDERYLPFEGAGVISKWRLELPDFRQFDYNTISDVIIHLKYTACQGGETLKNEAIKSVSEQLKSVEQELNETGLHIALNMKHDFPNEWHLLQMNEKVDLKINKLILPYMVQTMNIKNINVMFLAKVAPNEKISYTIKVNDKEIVLNKIDELMFYQGSSSDITLNKANDSFELSIDKSRLLDSLEELVMIVKYS